VGFGESSIVRSFVICTRQKILFIRLNKEGQYEDNMSRTVR